MIAAKDFVELEYTGKLQDNTIFDTTDESTAKKAGIHNQGAKYGPVIVCVGEKQILPGLEEAIIGKAPGAYDVALPAEKAFGKKTASLIQLVPTAKFHAAKINPRPGLPVNIDGANGLVKTVSGGRTIVDFNHPLSGKDVVYQVKVRRIVTDEKEKVQALVSMMLGDVKAEVKEGTATITAKGKVPEMIQKAVEGRITTLTKTKKVVFVEKA